MRLFALLLTISLTLGMLPPVAVFAEELPEEPVAAVTETVNNCDAGHAWADADCVTAKTCSVCGETEGEAQGHSWAEADCETAKTCSVCGETEGEALGHSWVEAACETAKTCAVCGATEGEALGHTWQETEEGNVCSTCGEAETVQQEAEIQVVSGEELTVEDYDTFLEELVILEQYAQDYASISTKKGEQDPGLLVVNFIRTGVERYLTPYWSGLAGTEITGFTTYVQNQDAANGTTAMRLRNIVIENFVLPNGNQTDFGHMFGTANILYYNASQNSHDVAGWAGDLCDLLLYSRDHGDVPEGTVDEMAAFILEKCFGVDADDAFGWDDFYGDMDAFYLISEWKGSNELLSDIMAAYFTVDLDDADRSAYFMNNRFSGLETNEDVRDAVYNAYINNTAIEILEADGDRNLTDVNPDLRKAACYAFADYIFQKGGDRLEGGSDEPTDPSEPVDPSEPEEPDVEDPSEPVEPENPYYEDFSVTESFLAPGISQSIHYALSADNKQMVYYVATVDVTRDDVTIMANYRNADPSQGWGMSRVLEQAEALNAKHSNPEDPENYIENFNVVVATNGDGYNMSTGEPGGLLVMGGVEYHPVDGDGFFAILKDGSAMIGTKADYEVYKDQIQDAIGGFGATLIKDGEFAINKSTEYYTSRASRTAIGITATGAVVMMVLDGRQEPFSCGGSMEEIAQIMLEAGCVHAINLDGGGSTTYVSKAEGADSLALVNRPSDGMQRSVAASLAAISTSKMTNEFDHANISADYEYLTIGSSVTVTAVGVSGSGNAAPIPEDAVWVVSNETIGTITQEGVFTAAANGDVDVKLMQGDKQLGYVTLHVVVPDTLEVKGGKLNAIFGVPTQIPLMAYYNGKEVSVGEHDFEFYLFDASLANPLDATAGTIDGFLFTGNEETGIRNMNIVAILLANPDIGVIAPVTMYKNGEAVFNFDDITAGNRTLAWKRGVSNSTTEDKIVYSISDPSKPMDITYVFGLDMESMTFPEKLEDIRFMLGGAEGSSAWDYLLMFAERISVLTEVVVTAKFDDDLDIDYSELSFNTEYFTLSTATLDEETNTLTIRCNWVDQTQAIDPETANPICILSGIKATPKEGASWSDEDRLEIMNLGEIKYDIYARFSSLYTFSQKPENQEKYGLYPYSSNEVLYNGGPEQGGHFSSTYASFEDAFTLDKSLRQGWYTFDDQMFYYVDHVALTGIQQVPSYEDPTVKLFYDFGEDGASVGKVTGLFEYDGGKMYAIRGEQMTGWRTVFDPATGDSNYYYFDPKTGKAVDGVQTIAGYTFTFTDCILTRGDLVTDETGTRYRWANEWIHGRWFEVDGNTYHTAKYQTYVTTGFSHVVGQNNEYAWHLFDENGVFQKDYNGKYHVGEDTYLLENGIMIQEPGLVLLDDGYYYYFCSTGKAVKNRTYWPTKTNGLLPMGPYVFDEEGRITNPPVTEPDTPDTPDTPDSPETPVEKKNGIHEVDGKLYYFKDDVIQYCAGLVQLEDGSYIYVRSNGQLAIGNYWITNHNNLLPERIYNFDENGIMTNPPAAAPDEPDTPDTPVTPEPPAEKKNGIVDVNGTLYYYKDDVLQYAAGLLKITNEDGSVDYVYVRSNGQLAIGSYWATNNNDLMPQGFYEFGTDGRMVNPPATEPEDPDNPVEPEEPEVKNGIVDVNGVLYYYKDNSIQYAAGVQKLTDENGKTFYIYVRSNGQLAIGNYWPTNTNGLLEEKMYNFGTDGRLYL